jgi:hypothetical protein
MRALAALVLLCTGTAAAAAADGPPPFSLTGLQGWTAETMLNRKPTDYAVVEDGGAKVLEARCNDSASMEGWAGPVDLQQTPLLSWRWKIEHIYPGLDERVKGGSDFPARVYVVVGKRWMPWTLKTLEYAWSNGEHPAASFPSPYSGPMGQAQIIPLRSGGDGVGQWQTEQRDVRADFKQFFGLDVDKIGAVAVMTDCDDAHGKGQAWFGDLRFEARTAGK